MHINTRPVACESMLLVESIKPYQTHHMKHSICFKMHLFSHGRSATSSQARRVAEGGACKLNNWQVVTTRLPNDESSTNNWLKRGRKQNVPTFAWLGVAHNPVPAKQQVQL